MLGKINKVSIQPAPARDFLPLEIHHFVSILRYLIQLLSLWSIIDCGLSVRVSSRDRVSVSFIFCIFSFPRAKITTTSIASMAQWQHVRIALHRSRV